MIHKSAYLILDQLLNFVNSRADSYAENLSLFTDYKNIGLKDFTEDFADVVEDHLMGVIIMQ